MLAIQPFYAVSRWEQPPDGETDSRIKRIALKAVTVLGTTLYSASSYLWTKVATAREALSSIIALFSSTLGLNHQDHPPSSPQNSPSSPHTDISVAANDSPHERSLPPKSLPVFEWCHSPTPSSTSQVFNAANINDSSPVIESGLSDEKPLEDDTPEEVGDDVLEPTEEPTPTPTIVVKRDRAFASRWMGRLAAATGAYAVNKGVYFMDQYKFAIAMTLDANRSHQAFQLDSCIKWYCKESTVTEEFMNYFRSTSSCHINTLKDCLAEASSRGGDSAMMVADTIQQLFDRENWLAAAKGAFANAEGFYQPFVLAKYFDRKLVYTVLKESAPGISTSWESFQYCLVGALLGYAAYRLAVPSLKTAYIPVRMVKKRIISRFQGSIGGDHSSHTNEFSDVKAEG